MNWNKLSKKELLERLNWRCKHGHNGISHHTCWDKEKDVREKVGFLDIEASNLYPEFGIVFCWCILDNDTGQIYERLITKEELFSRREDKDVVKACIATMRKFDRIVGHYSKRFDVPFLRTKALIHGLEFPKYGELYHTDTFDVAKRLLRLRSNRQNAIADILFGESLKTRLDSAHWRSALQGNKKSLRYILEHCRRDVKELKRNYDKLKEFVKLTRTSI